VTNFTVNLGRETTLTGQVVTAVAEAQCNFGIASISGYSQVTGLALNGTPITVTGQPNQVVPIPGLGILILNEQERTRFSDTAKKIEVSGIHLISSNRQDNIVLAHAEADVSCKDQ
jgi:hypothetical protein